MSVLRPRPPEDPLAYDGGGWSPGPLADRLAAIRDRLVAAPGELGLAPRTLEEYDTRRPESRLFAILSAARRIREAVDRLVIVAGGSIGPATRLLAASCCHPFHDQLPRGERGGGRGFPGSTGDRATTRSRGSSMSSRLRAARGPTTCLIAGRF